MNAHSSQNVGGRLATVSASQALLDLGVSSNSIISTGLPELDRLLIGTGANRQSTKDDEHGGFMRGQVVELYGPPGAGKTSFAMQACASALSTGESVVWLDCASRFPANRLRAVLSSISANGNNGESLKRLTHLLLPALAHLLALLLTTSQTFPPANTSLIIIESLSNLVDLAYPRNIDILKTFQKPEHAKWASARRNAIIGDLASHLARLAATRHVAILVTNQVVTRVQANTGAVLRPAMTNPDWLNVPAARLVLIHDWARSGEKGELKGFRFVCVLKAAGRRAMQSHDADWMVPFEITSEGLKGVSVGQRVNLDKYLARRTETSQGLKRPFAELEDADREQDADEYGWIDADEDQLAADGLGEDAQPNASSVPEFGVQSL